MRGQGAGAFSGRRGRWAGRRAWAPFLVLLATAAAAAHGAATVEAAPGGVAAVPAPAPAPARDSGPVHDGAAYDGPVHDGPVYGGPVYNGGVYDGRFTFVRIRWDDPRRFGGGSEVNCPRSEPLWAHDVCRGADRNIATIVDELTGMDVRVDGRILTLDDPELFRYPLAYIVEVGYWRPTAEEARSLREYLLKGGFLIVDDFRGPSEMWNFQEQMSRVLPEHRLLPLEPSHRVWDAFFHIPDPHALAPPTYPQYTPEYWGIFEDNDPKGRLMAVINFNNDIGDYWEWSTTGLLPIDFTNQAYKFGVNYVIYAATR